MRHYTKNVVLILISSIVFIVSPVFMLRMFNHTALASQWIVLAAIWVTVEWRRFKSTKHQIILHTFLLTTAILIHPYFVPMVFLFLAISTALTYESWRVAVIKIAVPSLVAIMVFWIIGGFAVLDASGGGLGMYSLNLNSLINPIGWSSFIKDMSMNSEHSAESLNYVGVGILLLLPLAIAGLLIRVKSMRGLLGATRSISKRWIIVFALILGTIFFSIGPSVQLGSHILFQIPLPKVVEHLWSIFRATGRIFWPVYYMILIFTLAGFISFAKNKITGLLVVIFLGLIVLVQCIDIAKSPQAVAKHEAFIHIQSMTHKTEYNVNAWRPIIGSRKNIILLDSNMVEMSSVDRINDSLALTDLAIKYNLTMNTGYYARAPWRLIANNQLKERDLLQQNHADTKNDLFLTKDEMLISDIRAKDNYKILMQDGYYIIE